MLLFILFNDPIFFSYSFLELFIFHSILHDVQLQIIFCLAYDWLLESRLFFFSSKSYPASQSSSLFKIFFNPMIFIIEVDSWRYSVSEIIKFISFKISVRLQRRTQSFIWSSFQNITLILGFSFYHFKRCFISMFSGFIFFHFIIESTSSNG